MTNLMVLYGSQHMLPFKIFNHSKAYSSKWEMGDFLKSAAAKRQLD